MRRASTPVVHRSFTVVTATSDPVSSDPFLLQVPASADGAALWQLIKDCPPLDLNAPYCYLLLCRLYADTCVLARTGERLGGAITALIPPRQPDTLFVWQVAVAPACRGRGLAAAMLDHLLARPACEAVRWLETTVTPGNDVSRRMFAAFARRHGAGLAESTAFPADYFPRPPQAPQHEPELLLRIGPLPALD